MPRKKLLITHEFPYHIVARSNNKERFRLPKHICWLVFGDLLCELSIRFNFETHAFVLMDNHYHLIGSASKASPLPVVMHWFQMSATRRMNRRTGRINHLFGGPYRPTLIRDEEYYHQVLKYVYRNPVTAGITDRVETYFYSSLINQRIPITNPITGIADLVPKSKGEFLNYLNESFSSSEKSTMDLAIRKREFGYPSRAKREDIPRSLRV